MKTPQAEAHQAAWMRETMRDPGHWRTDLIHNGSRERLLVFAPRPDEPTSGIYVEIDRGFWTCGRYEGAIPHIGDALFQPRKSGICANFNAALTMLIERLGLSFLFALTHGTSPDRSLA